MGFHGAGHLSPLDQRGRVANLGSRTYDYRDVNLIAANPVVFDVDALTQGPEALFLLVEHA